MIWKRGALRGEAGDPTRISVDSVIGALDNARGARIIILDACRNLPLAEGVKRGSGTGLARVVDRDRLIIAYAMQSNQVAFDGSGRNSPYAEALAKSLSEAGLEVGQVFQRVAVAVKKATQSKQLPEFSRSAVGVGNSGQVTFGKLGLAAGGLFGPVTVTNAGTLAQDAKLPVQLTPTQVAVLPGAVASLVPAGSAGIYARTFVGGIGIAATGTITGAVALGAGSRFTNDRSGLFNAVGGSTFGGGSFTNAGTVTLGPDATLSGLSSFTNASGLVRSSGASSISSATVTNAGMFDLQNGRAGDTLTVNGNYVGQDGRVNLDVSTQAGTADRLVITGNAGGTTGLNLLNLTPGQAFTTSRSSSRSTGNRARAPSASPARRISVPSISP